MQCNIPAAIATIPYDFYAYATIYCYVLMLAACFDSFKKIHTEQCRHRKVIRHSLF